jgi:hypothetical protein
VTDKSGRQSDLAQPCSPFGSVAKSSLNRHAIQTPKRRRDGRPSDRVSILLALPFYRPADATSAPGFDGNDEIKSPQERVINLPGAIYGKDDNANKRFNSLQKVRHLEVCIAIMAVLDFASLAKKRIRFIKEQDGARVFGGIEDPGKILFRLADVSAGHAGEINPVKRQFKFTGEHLRGARFVRPAAAGEERLNADRM